MGVVGVDRELLKDSETRGAREGGEERGDKGEREINVEMNTQGTLSWDSSKVYVLHSLLIFYLNVLSHFASKIGK
jgi:hypothetical protein